MALRNRILEKRMLENILEEYDIVPSQEDLRLLSLSNRPRSDTFEESYAKLFTDTIHKILSNEHFRREDFGAYDLLLCESFCLLWQNAATHENWKRLERNEEFNQGICGAMLMDLYAADKIRLVEDRRYLSSKPNHTTPTIYVDIVDKELTSTFIDIVLLNKLFTESKPKRTNLKDILLSARSMNCAKITLRNLRSRGIIGQSQSGTLFATSSRRQSTLNFGPIQDLERRIKMIGLKEKRPDSFMLSLLSFLFVKDDSVRFIDTILQKLFKKREYQVAKENLKVIVRTQATTLKSPKFIRKKFSHDIYF